MATTTIWVHYQPFTRNCNKISINNNHLFTNFQWKKLVKKWANKGARHIRVDVFQTNPDYMGWVNGKPNSIVKQQLEFRK